MENATGGFAVFAVTPQLAAAAAMIVQVADFHCPHRTNQDAGLSSPDKVEVGEVHARVGESFTLEGQGYWEGQESGAGASACNPYAGAVLLVPEEGGAAGKKVTNVCRSLHGPDGCEDVWLCRCILLSCESSAFV